METTNNLQDKINDTINSVDTINDVNVSPFFKDKTMQRLFSEKKEVSSLWNWFIPQLQLATLVCVLLVNIYVIKQMKSAEYEESISNFASEYGMTIESDSPFLNLQS